MSRDHNPSDQSKDKLANHEPRPIKARIKSRVDHVLRGIEQAGPDQWSENSAYDQRSPRENRQQDTVKEPNQNRRGEVDGGSDEQSDTAEGTKSFVIHGGNLRRARGRQQVDWIPHTAMPDHPVE